MTAMSNLEDDEGVQAQTHADIYWEIKDVSDVLAKRIGEVE